MPITPLSSPRTLSSGLKHPNNPFPSTREGSGNWEYNQKACYGTGELGIKLGIKPGSVLSNRGAWNKAGELTLKPGSME